MMINSSPVPLERPKGKHERGPEGPHPNLRLKTEDSGLKTYFAAFFSASTLSVFSQLNSGRPK
jgi:hypothetical protein